MSLKRCNSVQ